MEDENELSSKPENYHSTLAHFYRGEMQRSNAWRARLDRTTNWAIIVIAAILTFGFSGKTRPHFVLLVGILVVLLLSMIESRRYRTYIVWKSRVRVLEKNFLVPVLCEEEEPHHQNWAKILAADLREPVQKIEFLEAFSRRLRRVYNWLFLILASSWLIRIVAYPTAASSLAETFQRASIGPVAGEMVFMSVGVFLISLLVISLYRWETRLGILERQAKGRIKLKKEVDHDMTDWKNV